MTWSLSVHSGPGTHADSEEGQTREVCSRTLFDKVCVCVCGTCIVQKFAFLTPLKAILVNPLSGGEHILMYWVNGN